MYDIHGTKVGEDGRIVIPAFCRKEAKIKPGDEVLVRVDGEGIRICTLQQAIREAQDYFTNLAPKAKIFSEELLSERRQEAQRDNG